MGAIQLPGHGNGLRVEEPPAEHMVTLNNQPIPVSVASFLILVDIRDRLTEIRDAVQPSEVSPEEAT